MRKLESPEIPVLPVMDIVAGESVAYGVGEAGIIIQFIDRDECILMDWFDVVSFGIELLKVNGVNPEEVEIASPTVVE